MQRVHHGHLAAVLIILGVLCLACGLGDKLKEQAAEEAFEQAIEEAGGEGDVELDVGDEIDITDLPEWLSYPDAKATGKMTMAQDGSEGTMYVLETSDAIGTVVDWYKTTMSTWEQSASFETAESTQLVYTDGSTQTVQLTMSTEGEQVAISCWYAQVAEAETVKPNPRPAALPAPGGKKAGPGRGIKHGKKIGR